MDFIYKEKNENQNKFIRLNKKQNSDAELTKKEKEFFNSNALISIFQILFLLVGLVTFQYYFFILYLVFIMITFFIIKPFKNSKYYISLIRVKSIIDFCFAIFILINKYHLRIIFEF